jgi:PPM family protein phosphatase
MSPKPLCIQQILEESTTPCVESAGATDRGEVRTRNEDNYAVYDDLGLYVVADGVAGRDHGDLASKMAVELVGNFVRRVAPTWPTSANDGADPCAALIAAAVRHANRRIHREAEKQAEGRGMSTTFVGALVEGNTVHVAHVGDSRAYLFRDGELVQLTRDHSVANEMADRTRPIDWLVAAMNPAALTRALGLYQGVDVAVRTEHALPGDLMLLCSDGISNMLDPSDIAAILGAVRDIEVCARALIAAANAAGGRDNSTAVVLRFCARCD